MSPKSDFKHDLAIKNASGDEVGLTLVRSNNVPQYFESFDYAQAIQFFNTDLGYGRFNAERRLPIAQQNQQAGFGKEYADGSSKYHTGVNIDPRFENEVRAGPLATTVTLPTVTALSITNADFELNSDWDVGGVTPERSSAKAHGGTYSWKCDSNGE